MSFQAHMKGYDDMRTLYQTDSLYAWQHGRHFPPVMVEISPTHQCNQRCLYCYTYQRGNPREFLRDEVLIDSFRQLADGGVKSVLVQGTGEPLLHKALPEALAVGAERRLSIGLTTNGVLLDHSMQERILHHLFYVRFSVLDHDPKRYAHLHGCSEKQWHQLIENIHYAVALRDKGRLEVALWATVYLFESNFHDAYGIVKYFKDLGLDYIVVQEASYTAFSPMGKREEVSTQYPEAAISEMRSRILSLNDPDFCVKVRFPINDDTYSVGMNKECWTRDFCQGVRFYTIVSSDGEVYPCWRVWGNKAYSYGSLYEKHFEEIWRGERRREIERFINRTPPTGDECMVCNIMKLNDILHRYKNATTKWKDFLI